MRRVRVATAGAILLAVLVVATAAAGYVEQRPEAGGGGPGIGAGPGDGVGSGNGSALGIGQAGEGSVPDVVADLVVGAIRAIMWVSLGFGVVYVGLALWRWDGHLRRRLLDALPTVLGVLVLFGGLFLLLELLSGLFEVGGGGLLGDASRGLTSASASTDDVPVSSPVPVLPVVVGAGLLIAVMAAWEHTGSASVASAAEPPDEQVETAGDPAPGQYRSGTADHATPNNDVYRAWRELASNVGATEQTTPAEVARRAVVTGHDPDAVDELTALFREARYGRVPVEPDRERRARALADRVRAEGERT